MLTSQILDLRYLWCRGLLTSLSSKHFSAGPKKTIAQDEQTTPYRDPNRVIKLKDTNATALPSQCDVAIIGGGGMGSSAAYFLKKKAGSDLKVVVIERDYTYSKASTPLSAGCIRQQFTIPENIMMSRFGAEFLHSFKTDVDADFDPNFKSNGNLSLVGKEGIEIAEKNVALQNSLGVKSEILSVNRLKEKFPWINTEGVAVGTYGCDNEGWFDPWALLMGLRKKARNLGAQYVEGEVVDFGFEATTGGKYDAINQLIVRLGNNEERTIKFNKCILATGAFSGSLARKARIGMGPDLLSTPLPIEPRKRYIYVIRSQGENIPPITAPLVIDIPKVYFRREGVGGNFICGRSPSSDKEPSVDNLDVDMNFFEEDVWPRLANRVPAFESLKVVGSWAGFYEYNTFDCNGVVGKHPAYDNFYIAAGFSGHGIQKIPAIGRSIAELILDGGFRTIDLSLLHFNRIIEKKPIVELALA